MARPAKVSPERILAVAALEFAERGFAGARVDRIARRARVNKAMLYYHFKSKDGLYRTLLRNLFTEGASRLQAVALDGASAPARLDRMVEAISAFLDEFAWFPSLMMREMAEGGARLDRDTLGVMARLPMAVAGVVDQGVRAGECEPVHPFYAYLSMMAPLVFYRVTAPVRRQLVATHFAYAAPDTPGAFLAHMQSSTRRMLARPTPAKKVRP